MSEGHAVDPTGRKSGRNKITDLIYKRWASLASCHANRFYTD